MRGFIAGLAYLVLWGIAAGIIFWLVDLARDDFVLGAFGFALYFVAAHFLLKLFGYERGIFTAGPPAR